MSSAEEFRIRLYIQLTGGHVPNAIMQFPGRHAAAQTRQGAPALIRSLHAPKNARAAKSGPLMAIMALLLPGGTSQGLGGGIPMGSTDPMSLAVRAQLPQPVWG